jgi:hypothetical protein
MTKFSTARLYFHFINVAFYVFHWSSLFSFYIRDFTFSLPQLYFACVALLFPYLIFTYFKRVNI